MNEKLLESYNINPRNILRLLGCKDFYSKVPDYQKVIKPLTLKILETIDDRRTISDKEKYLKFKIFENKKDQTQTVIETSGRSDANLKIPPFSLTIRFFDKKDRSVIRVTYTLGSQNKVDPDINSKEELTDDEVSLLESNDTLKFDNYSIFKQEKYTIGFLDKVLNSINGEIPNK